MRTCHRIDRCQPWDCPVSKEVTHAEASYTKSALGRMSRAGGAVGLGQHACIHSFILQAQSEGLGHSRGQVRHNPCLKKQKVGQLFLSSVVSALMEKVQAAGTPS